MAYVEKTAKSVDEAVAAALAELGIAASEAEIEVLDKGSKGFLGFGRKDARVRVAAKAAGTAAPKEEKTVREAVDAVVDSVKEAAAVIAPAAAKKAGELTEEAGRRLDEAKDGASRRFAEARSEAGRRFAEAKEEAVDSAISALEGLRENREPREREYRGGRREPRRYVVNDEAIARAKDFLQQVFSAMKIEVALEKFINKNDGTVTFRLHGEDMGILIGKHGQTLDSLQYLTNLVANKTSSERVRVVIDVEDYRDRRIETLTRLAYRLADKVKRTGERVALEPMNPHERKIIHMALQGDRRVTTLSEGDDPFRHVVIELRR